jgi:SNF family Na+-dependent transporter
MILTAESLIRFYLSIVIAAISTAVVLGITWLLLKAFQVEPKMWLWIIGVITALIALMGGHQSMKESSWIGVPCPDCSVRGKLTEQEGSRDFTGSEIKQTSAGFKTFDNYVIDVVQTCSNCGSARSWTKQVSNQRS